MTSQKVKIILNPNADMGNAWRQASDLRPVVQAYGSADWAGTVYPTHATELARQAGEEGYDLVIAVGGDGTAHEVVNGLMQIPAERRPRMGVVPLGSGNDFAHAIGASHDPVEALRQALNGQPKRIDIGVVEDENGRREFWDNTIGVGFDAIVTIRSHKLPVLRGFLMYLVAVFQTIMLDHIAPRFEFRSDMEEWYQNKLMIVVCNGGREGGGFFLQPDARMDDGLFHYIDVDYVSRPMMFRLLPEFMRGTHGRFPAVHMGALHNLDLTADHAMYIHTDGEVFASFDNDVRHLKIDILPGALEVVV